MTKNNTSGHSSLGLAPEKRGKFLGKGPGKGASAKYAASLKRRAARVNKAHKPVTDIRVNDRGVTDSIFEGASINVGDDIENYDPIDGDGVHELDFGKRHNKENISSDQLDLSDLNDVDTAADVGGHDYSLDDDASCDLAGSPRKKADHPSVQKGYVTLPGCATASEVMAWWKATFDAFEAKCLRAIDRKKFLDPFRETLMAMASARVFTSTPMISMRVVNELGRQHLYSGMLRAVEADSNVRPYFITIISGDGLTSHFKTEIELRRSHAREQAFLRDVSHDYFAINELALFNSHGHHQGGQMLQRHTHAIAWVNADDPDPQKAIDKHQKHFEPNFTGIPIIVVRPISTDAINLERLAAYMFKAPDRCKSWRPAKEGKRGFINNSEAGDRPSRYLRMAQIRSMLSLEDATFAGGLGAEIRSGLIKTARAQCAADAPPAARLLHPDAVGSFWMDVLRALNRKNWNLPIIRTHK